MKCQAQNSGEPWHLRTEERTEERKPIPKKKEKLSTGRIKDADYYSYQRPSGVINSVEWKGN